jgi:hypothetical protein
MILVVIIVLMVMVVVVSVMIVVVMIVIVMLMPMISVVDSCRENFCDDDFGGNNEVEMMFLLKV